MKNSSKLNQWLYKYDDELSVISILLIAVCFLAAICLTNKMKPEETFSDKFISFVGPDHCEYWVNKNGHNTIAHKGSCTNCWMKFESLNKVEKL
jgi:hypothetical protein